MRAAEHRHEGLHVARQKLDAVIWRQVELDLSEGAIAEAVRLYKLERRTADKRTESLRQRVADIDAARSADAEQQVAFLLGLFADVTVWTDAVEFRYVGGLIEPVRRALHAYYAPARGCGELGF